MNNATGVRRGVALAALLAVVAIVAILLLGAGSKYEVKADFINAGQLVKGNLVQVAGTPIGKVTDLKVTPDGHARITMTITEDAYQPLRKGTKLTVRAASLSGVPSSGAVRSTVPPFITPWVTV